MSDQRAFVLFVLVIASCAFVAGLIVGDCARRCPPLCPAAGEP